MNEKTQRMCQMLQGNIHLSVKPVQRNKGQCLVARVAYATGTSIYDPRTNQWHNYRWKKSEVGTTILITRQNETSNKKIFADFWGEIEKHHKRKDAVPGRTMSIALPCELSRKAQKQLMLKYGRWLCDTYGVGVQLASHKLGSHNPHFHVAMTACEVFEDGTFGKKVYGLDPIASSRLDNVDKNISPMEKLRSTWADMVNTAYAEAGIVETVDHRSYLRRAIDKMPQRHEGIWQHLPCPVDCPVEYNVKIQTISEVLDDYRTSIHGTTSTSHDIGENAHKRMEQNMGGSDQDLAQVKRADPEFQYGFEGNSIFAGDTGRSDRGFWSTHSGRDSESESGHGYPVENQQSAEFIEHATNQTGGQGEAAQVSLIDTISAPLAHTVAALELEVLRLNKKFLQLEYAATPIVSVERESLLDIVEKPILYAVQSLELETLRAKKHVLGIQYNQTELLNIEKQSIIQTIQPKLQHAVTVVSQLTSSFEQRVTSFYQKVEREAAGRNIAPMNPPPASLPPLEIKKEPSWDEKLWQQIVSKAEQIQDEGDLAKTVFVACAQVWKENPKLELKHFAHILKVHSNRTESEKDKILAALEYQLSKKMPKPLVLKTTTKNAVEPAVPTQQGAQPAPQTEPVKTRITSVPHVHHEDASPATSTPPAPVTVPVQKDAAAPTATSKPHAPSPPVAPKTREWSDDLWERMVERAKADTTSKDNSQRLVNACIALHSENQKYTLQHFGIAIIKNSTKAPAEQARMVDLLGQAILPRFCKVLKASSLKPDKLRPITKKVRNLLNDILDMQNIPLFNKEQSIEAHTAAATMVWKLNPHLDKYFIGALFRADSLFTPDECTQMLDAIWQQRPSYQFPIDDGEKEPSPPVEMEEEETSPM